MKTVTVTWLDGQATTFKDVDRIDMRIGLDGSPADVVGCAGTVMILLGPAPTSGVLPAPRPHVGTLMLSQIRWYRMEEK